jgi:putative FmdB family regulatory protein
MPTYDYRCLACGHEFEDFHPISQPALRTCPKCKKKKLERMIGSGAGILFKGGGFYQTDYRSENYKRGESSEKDGGQAPASPKTEPAAGPSEAPKTEKSSEKPSSKGGTGAPKKKPAKD